MLVPVPPITHDHTSVWRLEEVLMLFAKPIVLNPWNIDALADIQEESGHRIYTILQLRLHPSIKALKEK